MLNFISIRTRRLLEQNGQDTKLFQKVSNIFTYDFPGCNYIIQR